MSWLDVHGKVLCLLSYVN